MHRVLVGFEERCARSIRIGRAFRVEFPPSPEDPVVVLRLFLESLELTGPPWARSTSFIWGAAMTLCLWATFL